MESQDLDKQMYHTLRCGIVHNFSLFPDANGLRTGAQIRSIALTYKESNDGNHLSNHMGIKNNSDAALFVAEDFINDIKKKLKKYLMLQKVMPS